MSQRFRGGGFRIQRWGPKWVYRWQFGLNWMKCIFSTTRRILIWQQISPPTFRAVINWMKARNRKQRKTSISSRKSETKDELSVPSEPATIIGCGYASPPTVTGKIIDEVRQNYSRIGQIMLSLNQFVLFWGGAVHNLNQVCSQWVCSPSILTFNNDRAELIQFCTSPE